MVTHAQSAPNALRRITFTPYALLKGGFAQTLASAYWPSRPDPTPAFVHAIELPDGDQIIAVEDRSPSWVQGDRIAVVVHGLVGNHRSSYMRRLARRLVRDGMLVIRVNLRGCGLGFGLARKIYHSGSSEDLRAVLRWCAKRYPLSPVTQIGFSLGANITLKMAGEDGPRPTGNLDSVVAISPPVDLSDTAGKLSTSSWTTFDQFFVWRLRYDIVRRRRRFTDMAPLKLPLCMTLRELDDWYTAPLAGFDSADDYYAKCSCGPFIPSVAVPGLLLCADDDPIVDTQSYLKLRIPDQVDFWMTRYGGHVGFVAQNGGRSDIEWLNRIISKWIGRREIPV